MQMRQQDLGVREESSQRDTRIKLLGPQLFHVITYVKFAVIFYEVLFFLNFPERSVGAAGTAHLQNSEIESGSLHREHVGPCQRADVPHVQVRCARYTRRIPIERQAGTSAEASC